MSMVSRSLSASPPQAGQTVFLKDSTPARGVPPPAVISTPSRGRTTGSSSEGTGTTPQEGQWIMGMGVPQYR